MCEAKIILMSKFLITQPLAEFEFVFKICPKLNKAGRGHSPFVYICVRVCVCVCERVTYCFIDAIRFYCLRFDSYAQFAAIWPQLASLFFSYFDFRFGFLEDFYFDFTQF